MGGRGSGGGSKGGGGGGLGSSSNPVTAGQLDKMTQTERTSALRAMPSGTIVSRRATAGDAPTRYQKDSSGRWHQEAVYNTVNSRGRLVQTKEWISYSISSSQLAVFAYSSSSFSSVKYPKK